MAIFLNFLKITLRNFAKNKAYVFINLLGLGLSLACCIVGYLNWKYGAAYNQNHLNHERIYKIHSYKSVQGEKIEYGITPIGLGNQIKGQIPEVTHVSRYAGTTVVLKKDLKVFEKYMGFVEDDYLEMFTFPFKYGNKEALLDEESIILTEATAYAYFGKENPLGEIITLVDNEGKEYPLAVGGVLEDIPTNSSMTFLALTHYNNHLKMQGWKDDDWSHFNAATFVMTNGAFPQNLMDYMNTYSIEIQNKARDNFQIAGYSLVQLTDLDEASRYIRSNWLMNPPHPSALIGPVIMAIQLLLIACFNFTNTSIAISGKRLKEIGIRKVMGSRRRQLIFQYMGENFIICLMALVVGIGIADMLVPAYSAIWDFINIELNFSSDPEIYLFLIGLLIVTALTAGAYPSLYISRYQPVKILRGNLQLGQTSFFSRILLGVQYFFTALAIISAVAFYNNAKFQSEYDVGYSREPLLSINIENQSEYEAFRPLLEQMPEVKSLAGTYNRIGSWHYTRTLKNAEKEVETEMMEFSNEYFHLMDLSLVKGRFFDPKLQEHDRQNSIVINERLVKDFGWENPIGQIVQIDDSTRLSVIGVVKNFYNEGFFNKIEPTGIRFADPKVNYFLMVKSDIDPVKLYDQLEASWLSVSPNRPFDAEYDEVIAEANEVNLNIITMFQFLTFVALILSTIGLYTLVSLNIIKRMKEIGVRKVLGATIQEIVVLVNTQFFRLLVVAVIFGAVASYYVLDTLMGSIFEIYQAPTVITMLVPVFLLVIVAMAFATVRILITALQNPVKSLRYE